MTKNGNSFHFNNDTNVRSVITYRLYVAMQTYQNTVVWGKSNQCVESEIELQLSNQD